MPAGLIYYGPDGAYQLKYAIGNDADDGEYTTALVAAVADRKIRVVGLVATVLTTAGVFSLKDGAGGSTIFQAHLAVGSPLVVAMPWPLGICETSENTALVASNGTGVDSYVTLAYIEVDVD